MNESEILKRIPGTYNILQLPWLMIARAKKRAAYARYVAYSEAWDAVYKDKSKKPPEPFYKDDPWFHVLVAEQTIENLAKRARGGVDIKTPSYQIAKETYPGSSKTATSRRNALVRRLSAINQAQCELFSAEKALCSKRPGSKGAVAMFLLGEALEKLNRYTPSDQFTKANAHRKYGGEVRQAIRDRMRETSAKEDPNEILDHLTTTLGWVLIEGKIWRSPAEAGLGKSIVGWSRFQNMSVRSDRHGTLNSRNRSRHRRSREGVILRRGG